MATRAQARYEITAVDRTKRAFRQITKNLGTMKDKATKAGAAISVLGAAGGVGVIGFAKSALNSAAAIKQLSTQTGQSIGVIQKVQKLLVAVGKGDQAGDTIRDLAEALGEARAEPLGEKGKALSSLGIDPARVKNVLDLVKQVSAAFAKARTGADKEKAFFFAKDFSDQAGEALASIGGDFKALSDATKGTVFDKEAVDAASQTLRQFRTLINEIKVTLQTGLLDSGAMKAFQEGMTRVFGVLGEQGVKGALAEIVNILVEEFPRAVETIFDIFVRIREIIREITAFFNRNKDRFDKMVRIASMGKQAAELVTAVPRAGLDMAGDVAGGVGKGILMWLQKIAANTSAPAGAA